ncbi:MAG: hypothetical protein NTX25_18520, partial [Proteobacteria bacterium]|nr:hypothetical protein [Pseudomonadota bacterium]
INPNIDRKVQLNWSNRSKTIDIYILKGFAFIKWSDILDKEFGERIDELSETELSDEQAMIRNELFIDSLIAYQNEPFVRDLLQGKIWKEYPFDWGNYK